MRMTITLELLVAHVSRRQNTAVSFAQLPLVTGALHRRISEVLRDMLDESDGIDNPG